MDAYDTVNEAVYHAATATREKFANKGEAISLVYQKDGKFYFTEPQGQDETASVRGEFKIPKGATLAHIIHNHPDGTGDNTYFSPGDIEMATQLKIPSAIIFGADPHISIYTPGVTPVERFGTGAKRMNRSKGSPFTAWPPQVAQQ